MATVPTGDRTKNVKFAAAYTSLTFNLAKDAFYRRNGVLDGMEVSGLGPTQIEIKSGAFIQRGIVVDLLVDFVIPAPVFAFPWVVYAHTDDEVATSPVDIAVAEEGSEPAGVVILSRTEDGDTWENVKEISIKSLREDIDDLENERKVRFNLLCNAGFELFNPAKGDAFVFPGPSLDCWNADNLSDKAPGSRLDLISDSQVLRGGGGALLTSESYEDPGGLQPDGSTRPARVVSNARIWQTLENYREFLGEELTLGVSLRLPTGHPDQLHDIEISFYGANLGTVGFSDTPVDKVHFIIPNATLTQNWQKFFVSGVISNLNTGLAAVPLAAAPGISVRIAFINVEPSGFPTAVDKVLIDDVMLYQGSIDDPVFFPTHPAQDWKRAETHFEAQAAELVQMGGSTDTEYKLGQRIPFRTRKMNIPTVSFEDLEVTEEGSPFSLNSEASYDKLVLAETSEEYLAQVSKPIAGFRPYRVKTLMRAQS